jgi:hypothetical protein
LISPLETWPAASITQKCVCAYTAAPTNYTQLVVR